MGAGRTGNRVGESEIQSQKQRHTQIETGRDRDRDIKIQNVGEEDKDQRHRETQRFRVRDVDSQRHTGELEAERQRRERAAEGPESQGRSQAREPEGDIGAAKRTETVGDGQSLKAMGQRYPEEPKDAESDLDPLVTISPLGPRSRTHVAVSAHVYTHACAGVSCLLLVCVCV